MAVPNPPVQAAQPTPPQRSDPSNFAVRADAWHTWFSGWTTTLTSIMGWVSDRVTDTLTNATAANDAATAAATSKTAAATSATNSASSATASASSASAASNSATNSASSASASASSASAANASAVNSAGSATASAASAAQAASSAQAATSGGIRFDTAQSLNATQQTQAQANLGATSVGKALITANSADSAQNALDATAIGKSLITAASAQAVARTINVNSYSREVAGGTLVPGNRYSIYTGGGPVAMTLPSYAATNLGDEIEFSNLHLSWSASAAFTINVPDATVRINMLNEALICNHAAGGFTLVCTWKDGTIAFWVVRT